MEENSYSILDNFNNPIFILDAQKRVIYKNISARKNIPRLRLGYKINRRKMIDPIPVSKKSEMRIETVLSSAFFKRAVACPLKKNNCEVWVFFQGLQYHLPDDRFFSRCEPLERILNRGIKLFEDGADTDDFEHRYDNLSQYLGKLISTVDTEEALIYYSANDMIKLTKSYTAAALSKFNRRFEFEPYGIDPDRSYVFEPLPYINIYANMLSAVLKITGSNPVLIEISQVKRDITVKFSGRIKRNTQSRDCKNVKEVAQLFPSEILNLAYIEQLGDYCKCPTSFEIKNAEINASFEISVYVKSQVHSSAPSKKIAKEIADRFMSALDGFISLSEFSRRRR